MKLKKKIVGNILRVRENFKKILELEVKYKKKKILKNPRTQKNFKNDFKEILIKENF